MTRALIRGLPRAVLVWAVLAAAAFAQSPLERAVTLAREKKYAESSEILKSVPEPADPGQRIAFHRLKAANASGLGDVAAAAVEMGQALALAPADVNLLVGTAMAEFQAGRLNDALAHAQKAGNSPTAKAVMGDVQEKQGDYPAAIEAYAAAVALAPRQEEYRVTLAFDLIQHQNFQSAVEVLQQSLPLFPGSARMRTLLGIAQYSRGESDEATATLLEAVTIDPKMESAYRCLAQIVLESSAAPRAGVTDRLCAWNATVCSALKLRVAREQNNLPMQNDAIAGLRRAPPGDLIARCELARALEWSDHLPEARREMEACVQAEPTPQNHYRMGLIYKRLGLDELSRREMEQRAQLLKRMSEESALGLNSLKSFR